MIRRMSAGHSATTATHRLLQAYSDSAGAAPDFSIGPFRDDITVVQYVVVEMLVWLS
jgi:hypothetical protein